MPNVLTTQLPPGQTMYVPSNDRLTAQMQSADASTLGLTGKINQLLFVDSVNGVGVVSPDGSIGKPFAAIAPALAYAVAQTWTEVQLQLAPGTYPGNFTVPAALASAVVAGWEAAESAQNVLVGGTITVEPGARATFQNCQLTGPALNVPVVGVDALQATFENCVVANAISSAAANLEYRQSVQSGDILSTGLINIQWDGWSWARTLQVTPAIPAGAVRQFIDAGHSTYFGSLASNGVAIGTYAFGTIAVPAAYLLASDRVEIQVVTPATQDFVCNVHGVAPDGTIVYWVHNISRVSTNFADNVLILVHHQNMVDIPPP